MSESLFKWSCKPEDYNFIKKETPPQMLSCEFCNIFQNTHFVKHLQIAASVYKQHWDTNCMLMTENKVLRKHFTFWLTYLSSDKSNVGLLQDFVSRSCITIYKKPFDFSRVRNYRILIAIFAEKNINLYSIKKPFLLIKNLFIQRKYVYIQ